LLLAQRGAGAATLLISEDLDEILALADRVAVIFEGRIVGLFEAPEADVAEIGLLMTGGAVSPHAEPATPGTLIP
jgi:simple sugar transport system ATP-binding protein